MEISLSIIIPIYNVEDTLRRCLDSIVGQRIGNSEILLVDDGSTDGSSAIADEYAAGHAQIRCFHKPNGGLSDARNYGLERARGRYVAFADSDDELAPGTYRQLMGILARHPDYGILEFPVLQNPGRTDETLFRPGEHVFGDALEWLAYKGTEHCWACNKVFRASLFDNERFEKGKKFEDVLALADIIKQKPVIATTDKGLYIYHYNGTGIAAQDRTNGLSALLDAQLALVGMLHIDTRKRRWHRLYMDMLTVQIVEFCQTGETRLPPQRIAISGYASWKDTIKAMLVNTIGLRQTCRLFRLIKKGVKNT